MGSVNSRAWPQAFRLDGTTQTADFLVTSVPITNAVGDQTRYIRLVATQDCFVTTGIAPTATSAHLFLPAGQPEYFKINPGEKVAAIRSTLDGTLYVSEMSA